MEEKIIIKSRNKSTKSYKLIAIICIILTIVFFFLAEYGWDLFHLDFLLTPFNESPCFYLGLVALIIAVIVGIIYFMISKSEIIVSDKRVRGKAAFGKSVDLPVDAISAISLSAVFSGVAIATASGLIKFFMIENADEIHSEVGKLLDARQEKPKSVAETAIKQEVQQSNADELKKYKELLDSGIITQEEFDAKKKQLLGL